MAKIIYEPHPVSTQRKAELREKGYKIIDARFKPADEPAKSAPPVGDDLDGLDAEQLHALAKERGVKVHHAAGADKVREALREAAGQGGQDA